MRLFAQCPDCQTYLPQEDGTGRYEGQDVLPAHRCFIGQSECDVEARPIGSDEVWVRLFPPEWTYQSPDERKR